MERIALPVLVALLIAVNPVVGQQTPLTQNLNVGGTFSQPAPLTLEPKGNFDSPYRNQVHFATPVVPGGKNNIALASGDTMPPVGVPARAERSIAQNALTQNHRLHIPPQVFEKNLVEKLGSRFVPLRGTTETAGFSRYRLPVKDGSDIELVINQQHGVVSVTGAPGMVESTLQIVRLLDTVDTPGGAVTRFVPVQQSSVAPAQRVANIVNNEGLKVAQMDRQSVPAANPGEAALTGAIVGPVHIEVIPDFNTMFIRGSPRDVEQTKVMIQQLEALSQENEPVIELIPMQHADSLRVSQLVQTLYQQVYLNRRGTMIMQPLVKPNTILLIGRKESNDAAKELIAKLDTPVNPNAAFRVFPLKYAAATELGNQINNSFQSRPGYGSGLATQLYIVPDNRTNALIVQASPRDLEEIAAMIRQMDVPGSDVTTLVRSFPLKNAVASDMASVLLSAIQGTYNGVAGQRYSQLTLGGVDQEGNLIRSSVLHNVLVVADTRSNTIVVTAPPETMPLVADLIYQLDRLPAAESKVKVFTLVNGNAYDLATMLTTLFGQQGSTNQLSAARPGFGEGESSLVGVRFQPEIRTNSIIAIGGEGDLILAEALLTRLDAENLNNRKVFTMQLINVSVDDIAPALNNYLNNERSLETQNTVSFLPQSPQEQYQKEINIVAEPVTNSLVISTTPQHYEIIRNIILELDARPLTVAIDVLIAEVSINRSKDRGVEFGLQDSILFSTPGGVSMNALFPGFSGTGKTVGTQGGVTSLIPASATGGFSFSASSESVSIFVRALETYNKTQILSRPRLVTLHNQRAQIQVGQKVPYPGAVSYTNNGYPIPDVTQEDVGTTLDVTPRIMPDGMISLAIYVRRSSVSGWETISSDVRAPILNDAYTSTTVNAMDCQTVIFAGLITEEKISENRSIPGLNRIPFIKHFFEYDSKKTNRSELLIVLTPRIIRTREDMALLDQEERERIHWCVGDVVRMTGDCSILRRSDEWSPGEVLHTYGAPVILHESQLPAENKIPKPMPVPMFPVIETK